MSSTFKILVWKNFRTERRRWALLLAELLLVLVLCLLIIANPSKTLRTFSPTESEREGAKIYGPSKLDSVEIVKHFYEEDDDIPNKLAYTPNTPAVKDLMGQVANTLQLQLTEQFNPKFVLAQVIFPNTKNKEIPTDLTVRIRFPGFFRTFKSSRPHSNLWLSRCTGCTTTSIADESNYDQTDLYIREGFLQIQHNIFLEYYKTFDKSGQDYTIGTYSFRYPTNERMCQPTDSANVLSFLYYFIFFLPFLGIVWKFGREREENLLAHHWRYDCSKCLYWWGHFIAAYFHFFIVSVLFYILTVINWQASEEGEYRCTIKILYLLGLLLLTACEYIIVAMVIVSLIPNAKNAVYFSILVWVLNYAIFAIVLEYSYEMKSFWVIFSLLILFNNDFPYGMRYLIRLDKRTKDEILLLFAIVLGNIVLKLLLLSLIQYIRPGRYMDRLPFPFCGMRTLCFWDKCRKQDPTKRSKPPHLPVNPDNYQFGPLHAYKSAYVTQLSASRSRLRQDPKVILKRVNLTIYKGEITVILGHNGSGKTTLLSILAGWRRTYEGHVVLLEKEITENPKIQQSVDISMPNNTLFDYLTAAETLKYYIVLKNNIRRELYTEEKNMWINTLKSAFKPIELNQKLVKDMTFDQKRLLTLCCTMACGSKVVLLDEPTLHMKSNEQRLYWSILQREKADRAIVVTTYSFREAETIGDRIAVLIQGSVKAYGTPMFLKTTFSSGFDLVILKSKDAPSLPITQFLEGFVPNIQPDNENSDQLIYKISADKKSTFQSMLIQLNKRKSEFGIEDVRLLTTDLSEVYIELGRIRNRQTIPDTPKPLTVDYLSKKKRVKQQWAAMFFKKLTHQASTVIPIFMVLASILLILLIARLLDVLRDRSSRTSKMTLGFADTNNRRIFRNLADCKFIGIKDVVIGNTLLRDRSHSFTFKEDGLYCSKDMTFENHLKQSGYMYHMYGAFSIENPTTFNIYYNQHIFHSAPLVMNLLHNYILEKATSFTFTQDYMYRVVSEPSPIPKPHATGLIDSELEHLFLPMAIGILLPITICTFIFSVAEERSDNILILMSIAGLRIDIYWMVTFIWDWLTFFVYSVLFQIVIVVAFMDDMGMVHSLLILLVVNIYSIPLLLSIYFLAMFKFYSKYRAYVVACVINAVFGLFTYVIFWDVVLGQSWFYYILILSPTFAMLDGVSNVYVTSKFFQNCRTQCQGMKSCNLDKICDTIEECCEYTFFNFESGILRPIVALIVTSFIVFLLIVWVEIHRRESKFYINSKIKQMSSKVYPYDDGDIAVMRERIARADLRSITKTRLVVDQVESKIPSNSLFLSTISFDANKQTILAIYGTHRVGKSHLCRQIIGEDGFRFGDIYVRGLPVKYNVHEAWVYLGYAPQSGGLLTGFTPIEVLHFFSLIRGVPKEAIPTIVAELSNVLGLGQVMRRKIRRLSRATQRKVSIAIAFVATNKVIILDEPTRGLPQWTRREIWNALRYFRECGKTIVITTTDMYECDAVADSVLLIDDSEMLAFGGPHYLRFKHVVGFYLEIRLRRDGNTAEEVEENLRMDVENLHRFMVFMHSDSILLNRIDNILKFYLPVEKVNFNILFGSLERNRVRLNIAEYTVGQGNFEEVLNNIASKREHKTSSRLK